MEIEQKKEVKHVDEHEMNQHLLKQLKLLTKEMCIANSLHRKFISAVIYGLGTVIGATLLVALVIYILGTLANHGVLSGFNNWLVDTIRR